MTPPENALFAKYFQMVTGTSGAHVAELRAHASSRRIFRIQGGGHSLIGVLNQNEPENEAFVYLAAQFLGTVLPVPRVHLYRPRDSLYLVDDLGDETLLARLQSLRLDDSSSFPSSAESLYRKVLEVLPQFQVVAARGLDFSRCYPESAFLEASYLKDMHSFVGDLALRVAPHEDFSLLDEEFQRLSQYLYRADHSFFVYRDFQARNIMLKGDLPYFIDFQGGRKGALQYDVVSLLYQSSAKIPDASRSELLEHYLSAAASVVPLDRDSFMRFYPAFVIARMLQVLGVYGREGLGAGKAYFAGNIPEALTTLVNQVTTVTATLPLPNLLRCARVLQLHFIGPSQL